MSARSKISYLFDFKNALFSPLSGAASGTQSGAWDRIIDVDTINYVLSSTGTVAGVWSVQVATDFRGSDAIAVDPLFIQNPATGAPLALPVPSGGALGPTTYRIEVPDARYTHIRWTFQLTGGAGNKQVDTGLITSVPKDLSRIQGGVAVWTNGESTSTQAGTASIEYADFYWYKKNPLVGTQSPPQQADGTLDLPFYAPALDASNTAVTIAAITTGGQAILKRLGALEVGAIRAKFLPTSGAGRIKMYLNAKAMG
jgi:hypothetical protein